MSRYVLRVTWGKDVLQNPVSSPTAKQLPSWLKDADRASGLLVLSITGLVFMSATLSWSVAEDGKADRERYPLPLLITSKGVTVCSAPAS